MRYVDLKYANNKPLNLDLTLGEMFRIIVYNTLPKRVKMADWTRKENKHHQLNWSGIINASNLYNNRDGPAILCFSELTVSDVWHTVSPAISARSFLEKRSILGEKNRDHAIPAFLRPHSKGIPVYCHSPTWHIPIMKTSTCTSSICLKHTCKVSKIYTKGSRRSWFHKVSTIIQYLICTVIRNWLS